MRDYYEALEVSKNASKEVIEKAYKVLVKKYHPDLQKNNIEEAKKKMQLINEAYDVLSDDEKRKEYDDKYEKEKELEFRKKQQEMLNKQVELQKLKHELKIQNSQNNNHSNSDNKSVNDVKNSKQQFIQYERRVLRDNFERYNRNNSNRLFKNKAIIIIEIIAVLIIILLLLWAFPPTHDMMINIYNDNAFFRNIVDVIGKIFVGIFNGIKTFFENIF